MTDRIEDGEPAFPVPDGEAANHGCYGLSIRDWFAGQALAGWMASFGDTTAVKASACAELAYELADAMLAARKGGAE